MNKYRKGKHTVYYHRYHIVWITKYRYKVAPQERYNRIIQNLRKDIGAGIFG